MASPQASVHPDARFYTPRQMATLLAVSTETIRRMVRDERLAPPTHIGTRSPRWHQDAVDRWIKAGCPPSTEAQQRIDQAMAKAKATRAARQEAKSKKLSEFLAELDGTPAQTVEEEPCHA